ncbi:hypothetical protein ACFFRR_001650 [Megaselia abdita]
MIHSIPKWMEHRPPFKLKTFMIVYNLIQVILNLLLAFTSTYYFFADNHDIKCMTVDFSGSPKSQRALILTWYYYLLKLIDLTDTIVFVLRKKQDQVTFLHKYHHIVIAIASYFSTRFYPGGHTSMLGIINCYVHVIMYFYYFLTVLKPQFVSLKWKRLLTLLQITQFASMVIHFCVPLFIYPSCPYSKYWLSCSLGQNIFMLVMFLDFYVRTYIIKTKTPKKSN